jgi:L-alanine-DL-glutamate epimerase-like enolase superfamily enzyme
MRLRVGSFPFPFRTPFEHAAAQRESAANVIAIAEDDAGHLGLGEGCPRAYVTGETVSSALATIARWRAAGVEHLADLNDVATWSREHAAEIDANPSAFAAVELALLDLLARRVDRSLEGLLDLGEQPRGLQTSAVYGSGTTSKFVKQMMLFNLNGMHDAKLKLSGEVVRDARRARWLARFGRVRLDANNLWSTAEEACQALAAICGFAWAIEEPLRARDWTGLAQVGIRTGLAIVLDESATRLDDLAHLVPGPKYVLNARVSKHGGLLRTISMIRAAKDLGLSIIVGAQVGETSILARAGIAAAAVTDEKLDGFECAFGTRLLTRDATSVSVGFGYGGRVDVSGLGRAGSGLTPTDEVRTDVR